MTPEQECAHQRLAQIGVDPDQRTQRPAIDLEHPTCGPRASADERAHPGDHGDLAGEATRLVYGDRMLAVGVRMHHLERALEYDEELRRDLTLLEQDLAGVNRSFGGMRAQALDLGIVERREQLSARSRVGGHSWLTPRGICRRRSTTSSSRRSRRR
ncbi:MAG TPA: hypothetical protein VFK02_21875 [Kofleriaceae bacterium]|nr:hypothetical protein [Kofleriaceae bacterium]